jgi:hypothetical protein
MAIETEYKQRDGLGYVKVTGAAETDIKSRQVMVGSDAVKIPATPLSNRRFLHMRNDGADGVGSATIYVGGSGVTTATGYPLVGNGLGAPYKAQRLLLEVSDGLDVYGKADVTAEMFQTLELS